MRSLLLLLAWAAQYISKDDLECAVNHLCVETPGELPRIRKNGAEALQTILDGYGTGMVSEGEYIQASRSAVDCGIQGGEHAPTSIGRG
jgi:hypothetical protein